MRIPAAGTVPWRLTSAGLEVAVVHRPRYDDWSWAKGKLDPGEDWAVAAVRETEEETGLVVRLGPALPEARYTLLGRDGTPDDKVVRYWSARVTGGDGHLLNEIDEVVWLDVPTAHARLDYARDRDQLLALVRLQQTDRLDTWPLVLVRHAHAVARGSWRGGDDTTRPLDDLGRARAVALSGVFTAYGVTRVVTSPSERCLRTVEPYAVCAGLGVRTRPGLSEEGFEADPTNAHRHLARLLERGEPALLCTHGPVLPALLDDLEQRLDLDSVGAVEVVEELALARDEKLLKGEALVCHVVGTGGAARVVAVERHRP
ncbi:MAG TPA: NUDIX hydrolase [Ornithinibacter sp.]|nr:NUDIX hydrolase [Ornithinibacter sp.]